MCMYPQQKLKKDTYKQEKLKAISKTLLAKKYHLQTAGGKMQDYYQL